jgi:hypothetical protein
MIHPEGRTRDSASRAWIHHENQGKGKMPLQKNVKKKVKNACFFPGACVS